MAPQLGVGTFRILDGSNNVVAYATSDYSGCANESIEIWALREKNGTPYPWPGAGNPDIVLRYDMVDGVGRSLDEFCAFLAGIPVNVDDFCLRYHHIVMGDCGSASSAAPKGK